MKCATTIRERVPRVPIYLEPTTLVDSNKLATQPESATNKAK